MSSESKSSALGLTRRYAAALGKRLALNNGTSLRPAGRIGREALASGLNAVDLVKLHERALIVILAKSADSKNDQRTIRRAWVFFVEALRPFEVARRSAQKSNGELHRRNTTMRTRTAELAVVRRQLKHEIRLRRAVQEGLASSKRHHDQLLEKSGRMQAHLRRLSHELLSAHEEERKTISRELHDEIGQTLTAVNVKLAALKLEALANTSGLNKKIASTQRLVEKSMNTVHRFARELRPPLLDDLGLIPALRSYMQEFAKRTNIRIQLTAFAGVERLDSDRRTVLYRVAQEALTNVHKHAEASAVSVHIRRLRGDVQMVIHDDGKSFSIERAMMAIRIKRLGLIGMRERIEMVGGTFTIDSAPGRGTTIHARVPFRGVRR